MKNRMNDETVEILTKVYGNDRSVFMLTKPHRMDLPLTWKRNVRNNEISYSNLSMLLRFAINHFHMPRGSRSIKLMYRKKIVSFLSYIGNNPEVHREVENNASFIQKFMGWSDAWTRRIQILSDIIYSKQLAIKDKLVAYGGLFYLVMPFDLLVDTIPSLGFLDDFGMLGLATAYYLKNGRNSPPSDT